MNCFNSATSDLTFNFRTSPNNICLTVKERLNRLSLTKTAKNEDNYTFCGQQKSSKSIITNLDILNGRLSQKLQQLCFVNRTSRINQNYYFKSKLVILISLIFCWSSFLSMVATTTVKQQNTIFSDKLSPEMNKDEKYANSGPNVFDNDVRIMALNDIKRSLKQYDLRVSQNFLQIAALRHSANVGDESLNENLLSFNEGNELQKNDQILAKHEKNGNNSKAPQHCSSKNISNNLNDVNNCDVQPLNSTTFPPLIKSNFTIGNFIRVRADLREIRQRPEHENQSDSTLTKKKNIKVKVGTTDNLNNLMDAPVFPIYLSKLEKSNNDVNESMATNSRRQLRSAPRTLGTTSTTSLGRFSKFNDNQSNKYNYHHHLFHHRRRRKACPPLHGKDQLLCPTRNSHRYDVCVTREQLCNHIQDCPNGEDEDLDLCFFYKPLDDQLKTLSHAVLLLVDSVMSVRQNDMQYTRTNEL